MEPITAIATALSSIKTATEIAQLLKTSDDAYLKAELKLRMAELMVALADTKIAISELKDVLQKKDEEIALLISKSKEVNSLVFIEPIYRKRLENGELEGCYCQRCYDVDKKIVRLIDYRNDSYYCNECKTTYRGPNYVSPMRNRHSSYDPFNI